jgi:REP element-mobilizing transposase RayT
MVVSILVATPHTAFGELLRISLEDTQQYNVRLAFSAQEARSFSASENFRMAILDADLLDEPFVPLCYDLLDRQKGIRLVIIPPENDPNHPSLGGLIPHGYLNRPFYLPELLETVDRLLDRGTQEPRATASVSYTQPPWLIDPLTLSGYLEKELRATQALACMVGVNGPERGTGSLRASAGKMTETQARELTDVVFRYWNRDEKTDLMRFMRLPGDKKEYLVYATLINGDLVLILVFDTGSPLSQVRPQTKAFAQTLAAIPPENYENSALPGQVLAGEDHVSEPISSPIPETSSAPRIKAVNEPETQPHTALPSPSVNESMPKVEVDPFIEEAFAGNLNADNIAADEVDDEDPELDAELRNLTALLGAIPPPDPGDDPLGYTPPEGLNSGLWRLEAGLAWEADHPEDTQVFVQEPDTEPNKAEEEARVLDKSNSERDVRGSAERSPLFPVEFGTAAENRALEFASEPELDLLEDTQPRVLAALTSLGQLEPVSPALSQLNYTCVLVPRLPQHYLTGELADLLSQWVQHLCLAFGWRLEGIAVRPEYLQWTVQVAPSISPGNLVRIIRQRTSQQIFGRFEDLQEQNPSGDYWAVGYLIVSGAQPPSAQLLRDYISQTRKRQGIIRE